ncbi:hypothetical protein J437_LFUL015453 [Ladona fulva]|uniref:PDZ domain-containing protein n=1 Tax=Ladona fulva TaxID=123851 RepID=A0A8K0K8P2_LADFU|nr:hypothetical protein J437_LFUL015453 [Ladona fulva]
MSPDGEELGFELVGGRDDPRYPNDSHVPNDCIVRVNGLDCSQANRRAVMEAIRSGRCLGRAGVAVRRRRVGGRCLYTTQLQLNSTKDHGLVLETGVYISKITPGSLSAKEGNLAVGDRVLSINGKTLDGAQGGCDAAAALEDPGDVLTITALKGIGSGPRISPSTSSPPPPPLVPPPTAQGLRHNMHSSGDSHSLLVATDSDHLSLGSSVSPGGPSVVVGNSPSYGVMEDACGVVSGSSTGRNVPSNDDGPLAYSPRGQPRPPSTHSEPKHQGNGMQESSHYKVGKSGTGAGGAWEMIREKIEMVRGRRSGKDRAADERVPRPPAAPPPSPGLLGDPEQDDAIAELDSVIDSYRRKQGTDGSNAITKRSKRREKEEALEKNGGTWPKCRGVGPGIAHANGTILHPRRTKERLPLSAILGNPPRYPLEGDCTNRRKRGGSKDSGSPSSTGPPTHAAYKSLDSSLVARLEAAAVAVGLPPSPRVPVSQPDNGAIDFSVKSGNIGREVLEYYVRKKGGGGSRSGGGASSSEGGSDPPSHARAHSRPHGGRPLSSPPHPYPADSPFLPPAPHPHHPHPHHAPHASSPLLRSPRHSSSPSPLLLPPAPPPGETSHNEARSPCFEPPYARQVGFASNTPKICIVHVLQTLI